MSNHFVYSINHFIKKFSSINKNDCVTHKSITGGKGEPIRKDCIQHCNSLQEKQALLELTAIPIQVWDGKVELYSHISTPAGRLVAYMKDIQKAKEGNVDAINKLRELNILGLL